MKWIWKDLDMGREWGKTVQIEKQHEQRHGNGTLDFGMNIHWYQLI